MPDPPADGEPAGGAPVLFGREQTRRRLDRVLDQGAGAIVTGAASVGVSAVLSAVARAQRRRGRSVRHEVAFDGGTGLVNGGLGLDDDAYLLILDDAERLDESEADQLRRAVLAGRFRCLIGTTHIDEVASPLAWLWRSGTIERIDIAPLTATDVASWVTALVGAQPDPPAVEALLGDSGGLPGLAVDTLRALAEVPVPTESMAPGLTESMSQPPATSAATSAPPATATAAPVRSEGLVVRSGYARLTGELPCPPTLRDRVAARAAGLSEAERDALVAVCLTGRLDDPPLGLPISADARAELIRRGLIRSERTRAERPSLVPAVGAIRRVVLAELGPGGVAAAAAHLLETSPSASAGERELWAALCGQPTEAVPTVGVIRHLVGEKRLAEAEILATMAAERGDGGATIVLAELLAERGDRRGAARLLDALLALGDLDPAVEIGATAELTAILLWDLNHGARSMALARRLCDKYGGPAGPASPVLLGRSVQSGQAEAALRLLDQMEASGRAHDHITCSAGSLAAALAGQSERAIRLGEQGLAYCREPQTEGPAPDPESSILALVLALSESGRLAEAQDLATSAYQRARGHPPELAWMALARGRIALTGGDLDAADAYGREAEGIFAHLDDPAPLRWAVGLQTFTAGLRGDGARAGDLLAQLQSLPSTGARFFDADIGRAGAWATHATGDTLAARRLLIEAAAAAESLGCISLALNAWHDAVRLGEREVAPASVARLAVRVGGGWSQAVAAAVQAVVSGDAVDCLTASTLAAQMGRQIEAAEMAALALNLAARRGDRSLVRASNLALAAAAITCPARSTPLLRTAEHVELTEREREVADRAAAGASSRHIAEDLAISVRTVDNLLSRVYAKLGITSRAELAGALVGSRSFARE